MWNQDIYNCALRFAAGAHEGQKIPGTDLPYIIHCASVCMEIIHVLPGAGPVNENLAVRCALLHDTLEDTETRYEDLASTFDEETAEGVLSLTKNRDIPGHRRMQECLERLRESPAEVQMVKLADRITNLSPPPSSWNRDKIKSYRDEAVMILEALGDSNPTLAERLIQKIDYYRIFSGK